MYLIQLQCLVEATGNCESNPCVNGQCKEIPFSFTCDCTGTGYKGERCEGKKYFN